MNNKNFDNAKKEARVSKIPASVNLKHLKEPDIDTLTYPKAVGTNNKLSTALKVKNALEFGKYFTFLNAALKPEDVDVKDTKFKKLIFTNREILSVLKRIEANQIDEQDTSIKHKDETDSVVINNYYGGREGDSESWSDESGLDLLGRLRAREGSKNKNKDKNKNKNKDKNKNKNKNKNTKASKTPKTAPKTHIPKNTTVATKNSTKAATKTPVKKPTLTPEQAKNAAAVESKVFRPGKVAKCLSRFLRGATLVGIAAEVGIGVYDYVNAQCAAQRQDAVANTVGAVAGAALGGKVGAGIGAAVGAWFFGIGAIPGAVVGGLVGAGIGAITGSAVGQWISDRLKSPLDLIPDKFTNQGPKIEYAYITEYLIPAMANLPYKDEADREKDARIVEKRLIELEDQIKEGITQEDQDKYTANRLENDEIVESNWFSKDEIKDWDKVNRLSDSDLKILREKFTFSSEDTNRIAEIQFRREAKTQNKHSSTLSSLDSINEALRIERQRLTDAENAKNDPGAIARSRKVITQLQQTKYELLHVDGPNAVNDARKIYDAHVVNNNATKRLQSSINTNTRHAELLSEKGVSSKSFNDVWATNFSKRADISSDLTERFNSIKAQDIEFNTSDHLGFVSGEFESGGNPGTIAKDNFGYAYGAWQMNSEKGILPKFVEGLKGDSTFGNLATLRIDSPDFQREWVQLAEEHPNEFLMKQHECISENLFMPVFNYAKKAGINVSNRAVQEALWSQAVQHGIAGNKKIIDAAASQLSSNSKPEDIVRALYIARSNYINGLSSLDAGLKKQLTSRYIKETSKALAVASNIDYQNSAVTKVVAADYFDGYAVNSKTAAEVLEYEEDRLSEASKSEISKAPNPAVDDIIAELKRKQTELDAIKQLKKDGKYDEEAEKRLNALNEDLAKIRNSLEELGVPINKNAQAQDASVSKRENISIQDLNGNNVDNKIALETINKINSSNTEKNPWAFPNLNPGQTPGNMERNSTDLTNPSIPFVN